ncbi:hypothetical protein AWS31_06165 [Enterobacter hormaechei subsp. steigerwaltii]|nr:hypothetical protein AWS31_06165 [Enterobacter hormaechei subsp. steigerwaltii]
MIRLLCSIVMIVLTFSASADVSGRVVRVLDGDTVEILETGNRVTRVRLAGIDAPEKSQPFGQRSRQALSWGRLRKRNLWSLPFLQHRF